MKQLLKTIGIAIVLFAITGTTIAQITRTATATATIVTPINLVKEVDMNFGNLAVTTVAGTCILTPASTRSITGGVTMPVVAGTVTAASFTVSGTPNYTYAITLPTLPLTINNTTGPDTPGPMTVTAFTSTPNATGQIGGGGNQTLNVGATVNVAALQAAGIYISPVPFDVTVNYN
jgi:hypothetical protein